MRTLSESTQKVLAENGLEFRYNFKRDGFTLKYPSGQYEFCKGEEEVLEKAKNFIENSDKQPKAKKSYYHLVAFEPDKTGPVMEYDTESLDEAKSLFEDYIAQVVGGEGWSSNVILEKVIPGEDEDDDNEYEDLDDWCYDKDKDYFYIEGYEDETFPSLAFALDSVKMQSVLPKEERTDYKGRSIVYHCDQLGKDLYIQNID